MELAYFIGGVKDGQIEALAQTLPHLQFAVPPVVQVTAYESGAFFPYVTVMYKYIGVVNTHYQNVHLYANFGIGDVADSINLEKLNILLKEMYEKPLVESMLSFFKGVDVRDELAWLNAGLRDVTRNRLCYWCAEEIVGPGFGKVNDLLVPKGSGKRVRSLVCGNCGRGKFNRRGERIGDWKSDEHLH